MPRNRGRSCAGCRGSAQQRGQGAALDQLHGEVGPAVAELAQLVDRHDARMLELAADLRLLDEAADQLGIVVVLFEQDLDGQVAAQVGVAALEDGAHAAAADLAQELVAAGVLGHLGGRGPDHRGLGLGLGVAEQDAGDRADRLGQSGPGRSGSRTGRSSAVSGASVLVDGPSVPREGRSRVAEDGVDHRGMLGESAAIFLRLGSSPARRRSSRSTRSSSSRSCARRGSSTSAR